MKNAALIIFVRNPVLGKVKTRLAASMGDAKALAVYKYLLQHTRSISNDVTVKKFVFYADNINEDDLWNGFEKRLQKGNDLGQRMTNAFRELFMHDFKNICIIGSDCLELDAETLNDAFTALETTDIVIGPAIDGGYYLMGMNNDCTAIFDKNEWGTDAVYKNTTDIIKKNKFTYTDLEILNDVDTETDLPEGLII
ncbi:MAG: TIGR04282 family arsenosugar biosynthesis glycosyltransferase [Ferruginibacter sp.]